MAAFGEKEKADLLHVGPGGDVDQIVLSIRIEGITAREFVQSGKHLLKVPGIPEFVRMQIHRGFGRDTGDVRRHAARQIPMR